jgi:hypothetical protein
MRRGVGDTGRRLREEYERGLQAGKEDEARRWRPEALERLRSVVDRFEEASGVKIDEYDGAEIGKAVRFVRGGGLKRQEERIVSIGSELLEALQAISLVVPVLPEQRYGGRKTIDVAAMLRAAGVGVQAEDDEV